MPTLIWLGCTRKQHDNMTNQQNAAAEETIRKIVDDYATTWNEHDMDAWSKLFADDVDYVNRAGGWWQSNDENIEGHRRIHEMLIAQGQPATFHLEVRKITFLRPDIALVHVESEWPGFNPPNGTQATAGISGIITMILEKKEEKWLIRALQNTLKQTP